MLSEALHTLAELARDSLDASKAAYFPKVERLPLNQIVKLTRDGAHEIITIDAPPRVHSLRTVAEIPPFVDYAIGELKAHPSIWITGGSVTVLIDDKVGGWLNEKATVKLTQSPQFELLYKWEKTPQDFDHVEFLRMLRRYFSEAIGNIETLLKTLKKLQFQNGVALVSTADTKRQSLGKEITSSVGTDPGTDLPELLDIVVQVYDDAELNQPVMIRSMLDITPAGQFRLIPLAGKPLQAVDASLRAIENQFLQTLPVGVPVFYGTP